MSYVRGQIPAIKSKTSPWPGLTRSGFAKATPDSSMLPTRRSFSEGGPPSRERQRANDSRRRADARRLGGRLKGGHGESLGRSLAVLTHCVIALLFLLAAP